MLTFVVLTIYLVYFYTKVSTYLLIIHWCHTSLLSHSNTSQNTSKQCIATVGTSCVMMSGFICLCQLGEDMVWAMQSEDTNTSDCSNRIFEGCIRVSRSFIINNNVWTLPTWTVLNSVTQFLTRFFKCLNCFGIDSIVA